MKVEVLKWDAWRFGPRDWMAGWRLERWWLTLGRNGGTFVLDVGPWRLRWRGKDFRPLFSERYGYQRWHTLGRLGLRHCRPKNSNSAPAGTGRLRR